MSSIELATHLASGATHVCHCWSLARRDGVMLGFTDHDQAIAFDGISFQPESGLSARALASTTGLSVNNTEAVGVLTSDRINETDIEAGRYDGAEVTIWLVQWDDTDAKQVRFVGTIGEITRASGGFQAELRGLTEALNQPQGRSYMRDCTAVLGDDRCRVDTSDPDFSIELEAGVVDAVRVYRFAAFGDFDVGWFEAGFLHVLSGQGAGLRAAIKSDQAVGAQRVITLWEPIKAAVTEGDRLRLTAGCDKRVQTCRQKFSNLLNFRGFPDIPGDDFLVSVPRSDGNTSGGSRTK